MRILLVSEGVHEEFGALAALVKKALRDPDCRFEWRNWKDSALRVHAGKGRGCFKRAIDWVRYASREGYDALVLLIDQDRFTDRVREFDDAQAETRLTGLFPRALGIAIRTFDAWILADETALTTVLGCVINRQPSPEDNRDPKSDCASILVGSKTDLRPREFYARVAELADIACLMERCPKGFGRFAARISAL